MNKAPRPPPPIYREGTAAARRPVERGGRGEGEGGGVPVVGHKHQQGSPERYAVREEESGGAAAMWHQVGVRPLVTMLIRQNSATAHAHCSVVRWLFGFGLVGLLVVLIMTLFLSFLAMPLLLSPCNTCACLTCKRSLWRLLA